MGEPIMCLGCCILWMLLLSAAFLWVAIVGIPWLVEYQAEQDSRDQLTLNVKRALGLPTDTSAEGADAKFVEFWRQQLSQPIGHTHKLAPITRPACTEPIDPRTGPR